MSKSLTLYPTTSSQNMMFLNLKYSYIKSVVNICSMVHFDCEMDSSLLLQACYVGALRNKATSIRLSMENKELKQYFSEKAPEQIEVLDYSDKSEEELNQAIDQWSKMKFPNKSLDTQLYKVKLILKPNGFYSLYFCVSHVIFDAYSIMATVKDILEIYVALRDGTAIPKPIPSPIAAYEADFAYGESAQHKKDYDFWYNEVFDTEPTYTTINGKESKEAPKKEKKYGTTLRLWQVKADFVDLVIKKELNDRVQSFAVEKRISPQCLYLLAARTFLSKVNDTEDVVFYNTVARRATKLQKRAGGTFVHAIPFRSRFSNEISFMEGCERMSDYQYKYYRHANIPSTEVISMAREKFKAPACKGYHSLSITYQPYFSIGNDDIPVHFSRHSNGAATMPLYLSIMPYDQSGDLVCNYEYIKGFMNPKRIAVFHNFMVAFLDKGLDNPEITLAELMAIV